MEKSGKPIRNAYIHPLAGKSAPAEVLIDQQLLLSQYYDSQPDPSEISQAVSFGTSGHRGSSANNSFNQDHILAIAQAIADYRCANSLTGPLYIGKDTHLLSVPAEQTALEVLAANSVHVVIDHLERPTPTPVISHAILSANRGKTSGLADGIVITPSHNPPNDGGIKYNPPDGGPAGSEVTKWIESRANDLLRSGLREVKRVSIEQALKAPTTHYRDFVTPYVEDLASAIDMDVIRDSGLSIGVDPLGGAALDYWQQIAEYYRLNMTLLSSAVDPSFSFMTLDHDGKIRMDCSSAYAMAPLLDSKDRFALAFGNDPDADRHGIVTPEGLMNPNHFLATAIDYLIETRTNWPSNLRIGKTLVSSAIIDRVVTALNREIYEVPVGFKWFADGLFKSELAFAGEESAGASFLRKDGTPWTTDKDGILLNLLAAEMTAATGRNPQQRFDSLAEKHGRPFYARTDQPCSAAQKTALLSLDPNQIAVETVVGEKVSSVITKASGNNAPIGGFKISTANGWFAVRPSGTEDVYKIYAESFLGLEHLEKILVDAAGVVDRIFS